MTKNTWNSWKINTYINGTYIILFFVWGKIGFSKQRSAYALDTEYRNNGLYICGIELRSSSDSGNGPRKKYLMVPFYSKYVLNKRHEMLGSGAGPYQHSELMVEVLQ